MAVNSLPLEKVVLFSSGVGFFEHAGSVEDDARVEMKFDVDDVNDLLKSMVVRDLDGGRVSTVSYGSKDPITRTLKTFAVDLTERPTLAGLLNQVRGERAELDAHEPLSGVIVGLEEHKRKTEKGDVLADHVLNLLTDQGLRAVRLDSVSRVRLVDEALAAELRQALAVLATAHSVDKKTVAILFLGEGRRRVRIGYIRQTPVWKTSYRLVLEADRPPLLQGWAIVENTTDEDWKDVALALVSGRPISFVMDLYQPLYLDRPVVEPELHASLRPQTYDQDLAEAADTRALMMAEQAGPPMKKLSRQARSAKGGFPAEGAAMMDAAVGEPQRFDVAQGVEAAATGGEVGELFQYAIDAPVSLSRQQSAMLPIVNAEVDGERISIYNQQVHARYPLAGLRLTNSTGLHLMQGPITVFDDQVYAGDAQIEDLPPGAERLVSYALDLDVEVAPETDGRPDEIIHVRLAKGTMQFAQKWAQRQKFTVKNSGGHAKKVLVEYPVRHGWRLVTPTEPSEKTRDRYRFAVQAEPGRPQTLVVEEEMVARRQVALSSMDSRNTQVYLASREIDADVKAALREIVRRKQEIGELSGRRERRERRITSIAEEQERIRKNMTSLDHASELYRRYVKTLNDQEDELAALRDQIQELVETEAELGKALDEYITGLDLGEAEQ